MAAVSAWTACLKDLEQLAAEPPSSSAAVLAYNRLLGHWTSFETAPPLPRAALNKLVAKLKIPLKLFSSCNRAAQSQPQSALVLAAVSSVRCFLHKGVVGSSSVSDSVSSIHASIQQQFEQSGLLQQLPALLTAAADELDKQANQGSGRQDGSTSSASGLQNFYQPCIASHATELLLIFRKMFDLWPAVDTASGAASLAIYAGSAPAAVRLALAARRYVSSRLRQSEQGPPAGAAAMLSVLEAADESIIYLCVTIRSVAVPLSDVLSKVPEIKQLFLSQQFMPCLMTMIATLAARLLLTPGTGPTGGANSSSTGTSTKVSSSSSSSRPRPSGPSSSQAHDQPPQQQLNAGNQETSRAELAEVVEAWQQACSKQSRLTATHHKLFELFGVDSRTALWATGALGEFFSSPSTLVTHLTVYTHTLILWEDFHHVWQGVGLHAHLWLAAVVLQCTASMPADSILQVICYKTACTSFKETLTCWRCLMQRADADPSVSDDAAELQSQQVLGLPVRQQPAHMLLLPAVFVREVLPHILTLCSQLQVSLSAIGGADPAPISASALLADKSTPIIQGANLPATTDSKLHASTEVVSLLYWLLLPDMAVQAQLTDTHLAGAQRTASGTATMASEAAAVAAATIAETNAGQYLHTAAGQSYLALFQVHALQIMASIEGAVRSVVRTATSAASSQACDDTLIMVAYMCHGEKPVADSQGPLLIMARAAGPGSPEQRQLYSLLSSMLKLRRHSSIDGVQRAAQFCRMAAAANAVALLSQQAAGSREAEVEFERLAGRTAAGAVSNTAANAVPADLSNLLPSLLILGCCCLLWAEQLRQEIPSQLLQPQAASVAASRRWLEAFSSRTTGGFTCSASQVCFSPIKHAGSVRGISTMLLCWLYDIGDWLQSSNTSAQLASTGYDQKQLLQKVNGMVSTLCAPFDNYADDAPLSGFVQQLLDLGVALSSVATPHACNNPNCSNVSGPSERQLVSCRSCMCAGCRTARYCSKACQKQHWKQHKPTCQALAAAAAALMAQTVVTAPT